ncbi:MAG: histidinol dehydrogenase [Gammaproteobacteria bacterium]|nr:histidinol dehydrogenase [Gammaproteobacteria bacterium]
MLATPVAWNDLDASEQVRALRRPGAANADEISDGVKAIIDRVVREGDAALRELSLELDDVGVDSFELSSKEIQAAMASLDEADAAAIEAAIANVRKFHQAQIRPSSMTVEVMPGICCEKLSHPIESVGLYVPAGSAPLPSTAIMLAVPAAVAGCPQRILCTPPDESGAVHPAIVFAAVKSGVERIFRVGGAQAIAAMAFGTESIPRVARIFGPGNRWVTTAKTLVSSMAGGPSIDMPAGPSEVLVIADSNADPDFVALDLLSQAEHGPDSHAVLISTSHELATAVRRRLEAHLGDLPRRDIACVALAHSPSLVVDSVVDAVDVSNRYAPEHLILQVDDPRRYLDSVRNAGSVFLGRWSPEAVGDYCSGTNHVLPTAGYARSYSGLGVDQFMRQMTVQELSQEGLRSIAGTVERLAGLEGLAAHAGAVRARVRLTGNTGDRQ